MRTVQNTDTKLYFRDTENFHYEQNLLNTLTTLCDIKIDFFNTYPKFFRIDSSISVGTEDTKDLNLYVHSFKNAHKLVCSMCLWTAASCIDRHG